MATPNLALIPTGYKAGKVYSVLPETGVGDFAFTRASAATRINSNGLLEVPQYSIGSDVVTNGNFATDTDWTKQTGWTISGGTANCNITTEAYGSIKQNVLTVGKTYKVTFSITSYTSGRLRASLGNVANGTLRNAIGTYTEYLTCSGNNEFAFYTWGSFVGSIDNVSVIEWAINDVPRLEYPLIDGVVNGCPSLLLENQATNLITYPISFGNSYWTKSGASIEGDPSTAGAEQVTNGDFATDSDWNKGTGWTISGGTASCNGTQSGTTEIYQSVSYPQNSTFKVQYTISNFTAGLIKTSFFADSSGTFQGANGLVVEYITVSNTGNGNFGFSASSNFNGSIDNVSVKEVQGYSSPSVDFPTSAFKLVEDTGTGSKKIQAVGINTSAADYSFSVIVKPNGRNEIGVGGGNYFVGGSFATFNLETKTVTLGSNAANGKIETLSNGWFRCSFTTPAVSGNNAYFLINLVKDGSFSYQGDGTSGVYIFMAQVEQGSVATSPTLTSLSAEGTTTTRVAEACNGAGDASTFNDSEGVLMAEISALGDDLTFRTITLSDGTTNNNVGFGYRNSSNVVYTFLQGVINSSTAVTVSDITALNKVAVKYKSGNYAMWINGIEVYTSTTAFTLTGLNEVAFDNGAGAAPLYGKTKQIQYFNTVLTSAEIETLTSWTSFTAMANAQQYNII